MKQTNTEAGLRAIVTMLGVMLDDCDFAMTEEQVDAAEQALTALMPTTVEPDENGYRLLEVVGAVSFTE